jgi:hypothetical protein
MIPSNDHIRTNPERRKVDPMLEIIKHLVILPSSLLEQIHHLGLEYIVHRLDGNTGTTEIIRKGSFAKS